MAGEAAIIVARLLKTVADLNGRVYPLRAPAGTPSPFAVYSVINELENEDLSGDVGIADVLIQVDIYSKKLADCVRITKQSRSILRNSPETDCYTEDSMYEFEDDTELYRISSDYKISVASGGSE